MVQVQTEAKPIVNRTQALVWLRQMMLIRRFEERAEMMYQKGNKIGGFFHQWDMRLDLPCFDRLKKFPIIITFVGSQSLRDSTMSCLQMIEHLLRGGPLGCSTGLRRLNRQDQAIAILS